MVERFLVELDSPGEFYFDRQKLKLKKERWRCRLCVAAVDTPLQVCRLRALDAYAWVSRTNTTSCGSTVALMPPTATGRSFRLTTSRTRMRREGGMPSSAHVTDSVA